MYRFHDFGVPAARRSAMFLSIPVLAAALALSVPAAWAQNDAGTRAPNTAAPGTTGLGTDPGNTFDAARTTAPETRASHDMRVSQLIGKEVRNPQGESLGQIQDLVIDVGNQRVHYAVLAFGGFLGMNEKLFAYPVRLFRQGADREQLVLNVNREQLREWPGFERNRWPNWNDEAYRNEVERFHGRGASAAVTVQARQNMRLVRASELLDRDINDLRGNDAGAVEDLVVNLGDGTLRYMVMEFDRAWNPDDKLLALPMTAFDVPTRQDVDLRLRVERERLRNAPGFAANRWPDLNSPEWQRRNDRWIGNLGERGASRDASY
ncbi:PRC-barrel domain-containing protein [Caldimonas tepidiphila]|uniref:PRC-barrel domain-containing protein n=1 Tax=Caldimonas tepidiphila TaxID=2315841 RepID=UPI0013001B1A|nr:PRC-barrel domain-containing protein [Caldimonas tepidiphila]